jgi:hypothetical protein
MSLRSIWFPAVVALAIACGGGKATRTDSDEPTTAKEKQLRDAKAAGELDKPSAKWGKWRYTGDRDDCFYVAGRRCFKTENAACQASKCKKPQKCTTTGGGPATVSCK